MNARLIYLPWPMAKFRGYQTTLIDLPAYSREVNANSIFAAAVSAPGSSSWFADAGGRRGEGRGV